jgi:Flp pilus assembly protein TadG
MRTLRRLRLPAARGAAAVEFALVAPFLLLLVLGCIEWGFYFFLENVVVNSAREAARAGSIAPIALVDARARAALSASLTAGALDPSRANATVTVTADSVVVTVTYPAGSVTGATFVPRPARAWARAEMRR